MIELDKIGGIADWERLPEEPKVEGDKTEAREIYIVPGGKAFLVVRPKTFEVRTDRKLAAKLREDYESVMESRYFGRNGIEVVPSGQLDDEEIKDLVRLSYNLTKELEQNA